MKKEVCYIILIFLFVSSCSSSDIEFESEKWKNWVETETTASLRWDMRNDLLRKHELVGMSIIEIVDLLGEPENSSKNEFRYYLGMARSGIDTGSLILTIESGVVIKHAIWHG